MNLWKVILATLVIFTAGILTGAVVSRFACWTQPHGWHVRPADDRSAAAPATNRPTTRLIMPFSRPPSRAVIKDFLGRLDRELDLQPEQHRRIQKILEESQKNTKEIWEKIAPEVREEMKRSREEIRNILTAEQRKRMDELMKSPAKTNAAPAAVAPPSTAAPEPPESR